MSIFGDIIDFGGDLIGGAADFLGAVPIVGDVIGGAFQSNWARREGRAARGHQERLLRQHYPIMVEGLKAAGLNPILAAGGSGPSAPSAAAASIASLPSRGAATTAQRLFKTQQEMIRAQTRKEWGLSEKADFDATAARWNASTARELQRQAQINTQLLRNQLPGSNIEAELERRAGKMTRFNQKMQQATTSAQGAMAFGVWLGSREGKELLEYLGVPVEDAEAWLKGVMRKWR